MKILKSLSSILLVMLMLTCFLEQSFANEQQETQKYRTTQLTAVNPNGSLTVVTPIDGMYAAVTPTVVKSPFIDDSTKHYNGIVTYNGSFADVDSAETPQSIWFDITAFRNQTIYFDFWYNGSGTDSLDYIYIIGSFDKYRTDIYVDTVAYLTSYASTWKEGTLSLSTHTPFIAVKIKATDLTSASPYDGIFKYVIQALDVNAGLDGYINSK